MCRLALILAAFVAAVPVVAGAGTAGSSHAAQSEIVAATRCNGRMIDDYQIQIQGFERHPPGNDNAIWQQLRDLGDTLSALSEEHNVLDHVCANDTDKAPLFAQINAATATGLVIRANLTNRLYAPCPPAATAVAQAQIAQAWLAVAATINDQNGTIPVIIAPVIPKIQARAAAFGMALPTYTETSAYWRDQFANAVPPAMQSCAGKLPTPPPTPTPAPIDTPNP
jgi:hypothetical protein